MTWSTGLFDLQKAPRPELGKQVWRTDQEGMGGPEGVGRPKEVGTPKEVGMLFPEEGPVLPPKPPVNA